MFKKLIQIFALPTLMLFSGWAYSVSFPAVQNLQVQGNALTWDTVADAGGYNIYYYPGGPSKYEITIEYLTTVKHATSLSNIQPGIYKVIAFNQEQTLYGDSSSAESLWLRGDGTVDDFNSTPDTAATTSSTSVTYYGADNDRYLVQTECTDNGTGFCTANCNYDGNIGYVTGGFCSANIPHLNSSGYTDHYTCYTPEAVSVMATGAYCSK